MHEKKRNAILQQNGGSWMGFPDESFEDYYREDNLRAQREIDNLVARVNRGDCVSSGPNFSGGFDLIALPEPEPAKMPDNPFDALWDTICTEVYVDV